MGRIGTLEILILLIIPIILFVITFMLGYRAGRVRGERDTLKKLQDNQNSSK
jgi:hypothetical protein